MIPRFTMRQALSAPDLLGNALVTPTASHCQHGVACSGSSQGTARMMSSSWAHHHRPLAKPTTQDYIASSTRRIERADQSARAGLPDDCAKPTGGPLATQMKRY